MASRKRTAAVAARAAIQKAAATVEKDAWMVGTDDSASEYEDASNSDVEELDVRTMWIKPKKRKQRGIPDVSLIQLSTPQPITLDAHELVAVRLYGAREYGLLRQLLRDWCEDSYSPKLSLYDGLMVHPVESMTDEDFDALASLFVYINTPLHAYELRYMASSHRILRMAALCGTPLALDPPPLSITMNQQLGDEMIASIREDYFTVNFTVAYLIHDRRRLLDQPTPDVAGVHLFIDTLSTVSTHNDWMGFMAHSNIGFVIYHYYRTPYENTLPDDFMRKLIVNHEQRELLRTLPHSAYPPRLMR